MVTIVKPIYTQELIWGVEGAKTLPPTSKVKGGWVQEMMPAEYENWIQNRQDQAIAYLYQFGLAEWDSLTEYVGGRSIVQMDGRIYRAVQDSVNVAPTSNTAYWVNIFSGLSYVATTAPTGAANMPAGTTAQRPTSAAPANSTYMRYNSSVKRWEFLADGVWSELVDRTQGVTGSGKVVFADSPVFTGIPAVPTQAPSDNSTRIASTAFVKKAIADEQAKGVAILKPTTTTKNVVVQSFQDVALPIVPGSTSYLMVSLETSGVAGDLWDIEIYNSTPQAGNLLYYARLIQGSFVDRIPILLTTPAPILRVVNQRSDGNASTVKVTFSTISCA